jgi:RNA recognition motif-containing protein
VWGQPREADEDAWSAAPPSFQPPVRRVDPLSLTAVEVEVDGVKKLVGQRVQVSGLSEETTWHTLKDHLRQAGDLTFCRVYSGGRGMAEFATPEDAARCITELQASELEGATLYLREDREDTVLLNTRRRIREAREAQLRARKEEAERARREKAVEQGDAPSAASSTSSAPPA